MFPLSQGFLSNHCLLLTNKVSLYKSSILEQCFFYFYFCLKATTVVKKRLTSLKLIILHSWIFIKCALLNQIYKTKKKNMNLNKRKVLTLTKYKVVLKTSHENFATPAQSAELFSSRFSATPRAFVHTAPPPLSLYQCTLPPFYTYTWTALHAHSTVLYNMFFFIPKWTAYLFLPIITLTHFPNNSAFPQIQLIFDTVILTLYHTH